jgi:hypothetical protein
MKAKRGKKRYSSTLSLTSPLDGVDGQVHAPVALSPEKELLFIYRKLGEPQGPSARSESPYQLSYPGPPNGLMALLSRHLSLRLSNLGTFT